jgi:hypothetical protein
MIRRLIKITLLSTFILAACGASEFAARLYVSARASVVVPSKVHWNITDYGYMWPNDYNSPALNIRDGYRVTTDQPGRYTATVWLFGNSTLYDADTDAVTIASYLQREVNAAGIAYRVVNVGVPGAVVFHEMNRLKDTPVQPGDIVMFYDGAQDAANLYYQAKEYAVGRDNSLCGALWRNYSQLAVISIACGWIENSGLPDGFTWSGIDKAAREYEQTVAEAAQIAGAKGAAFYHFLQPHYWATEPNSTERRLSVTPAFRPGMDRVFRTLWGGIRTPWTIDLENGFDAARRADLVAFHDCCHVNYEANEIIARVLFNQLTIF